MSQDPWVTAVEGFAPRARQMLGVGPDTTPEDLLASFEQDQRRALEADERLAATQFTIRSDNELISVTMTGKAQILSLVIADEALLRYRARDLGPAVLQTVNAAMAHCGELVRQQLAGVLGDDAVLDAVMQSWPGRAPAHAEAADETPSDWT